MKEGEVVFSIKSSKLAIYVTPFLLVIGVTPVANASVTLTGENPPPNPIVDAIPLTSASHTIMDLGPNSFAYSINNSGQAAGYIFVPDISGRAALWNGGISSDLGTLSGTYTLATSINNVGQVAGSSSPDPSTLRAAIWNNGTPVVLGTLGGAYSHATSINDAGQVVGESSLASNAGSHATLWSGGTITDLGTLGGQYSMASSINGSGQVAGWSSTINGTLRPVLWDGGAIIDLGTLGGDSGYAYGINDLGQIVGRSYLPNYMSHATLWHDGIAVDLGTLSGGNYSQANGINNAGEVVGESTLTTYGVTHATLWSGGAIIDLNSFLDPAAITAGWTLNTAFSINSSGWIVGDATNSLGEHHAFQLLVTSVPEPMSYTMMLSGLGLLIFISRRRGIMKSQHCAPKERPIV